MCMSAASPQKSFSLRHVQFSINQTVNTRHNAERSTWYTIKEIESFKNDARTSSRAIRERNLKTNNVQWSTTSKMISKHVCKRGLECRIDLRRQIRKIMLIKKVLKAQNIIKFSNQEEKEQYLAKLSCKESFLAKCEALTEASLDAKEAS